MELWRLRAAAAAAASSWLFSGTTLPPSSLRPTNHRPLVFTFNNNNVTEDSRETVFLFQRLSIALQRGNAVSFLSTFTATD